MTLPRSGVAEGAGADCDGRAGCVSVVCVFRGGTMARELSSALGSSRRSPVVAEDEVSRAVASVLPFGREASLVEGAPLSEMTVGSFGAFAWPGFGGL